MPKIVNIPAGSEAAVAPTVGQLREELETAEEVFDELIAERRANRDEMSKAAFRVYNEETADEQIEKQHAVASAQKKLARAEQRSEQRVKVGVASEANEAEGVS